MQKYLALMAVQNIVLIKSDDESDKDYCSNQEHEKAVGSEVSESRDVLLAQEECSSDDVDQMAQDVETVAKQHLLNDTIMQKLKQQHKSIFKKLPSSTIPMYECAQTQKGMKKIRGTRKISAYFWKSKAGTIKQFLFERQPQFGSSRKVNVSPQIVCFE